MVIQPMDMKKQVIYMLLNARIGAVSGTEVRNGLSQGSDEQKEKFFKDRAMVSSTKIYSKWLLIN